MASSSDVESGCAKRRFSKGLERAVERPNILSGSSRISNSGCSSKVLTIRALRVWPLLNAIIGKSKNCDSPKAFVKFSNERLFKKRRLPSH